VIRTGTKFRIASLAATAAFIVSACSGSTASPAATTAATQAASAAPASQGDASAPASQAAGGAGGTINIGFEGPYTGDSAASGQELKNAINMTMDAANWTVGNYKINPVWIDDATDPAKGAAAYEQAAVSQNIQAVLGGWNSSVAVAEMDVAAKYKIPSFFSCGAANTVTTKWQSDATKYGYWVAKCWPDPSLLVTAYVEWLDKGTADGSIKVPDKTFALWGEDTDWGRTFAKAVGDQLVAKGWTKKSEDIFPLSTTDFTSLVSKWNADKPSVIVGTTTSGSVNGALLKAVQDGGNKALFISDGVGQDPNFYKNIGSASDYVIDSAPLWTRPGSQQFVTDYKAKFGNDPSSQAAGLAYDYAHFFLKILQATIADQGSLTSATIYKEAQDKLWTGQLTYTDGVVMPSYQYSKDSVPNPVVGGDAWSFPVVQWIGGKSTLVYPNGAAGAYQPKP
jgi:branched-chain amino acid transport system substrate-binding protein